MIDLKSKQIALDGHFDEIKQWEVWWRTPLGLFNDYDGAYEVYANFIKESEPNWEPILNQNFIPVVVAVNRNKNGVLIRYEEVN